MRLNPHEVESAACGRNKAAALADVNRPATGVANSPSSGAKRYISRRHCRERHGLDDHQAVRFRCVATNPVTAEAVTFSHAPDSSVTGRVVLLKVPGAAVVDLA